MDEMDDLDFDDVEDPRRENKTLQELRAHADQLKKEKRAAEKELAELKAFKETYDREQRSKAIESVFTELEIDTRRAKYFNLENPDAEVTKETVAAWATQEGFLEASKVEAPAGGFVPTVVEGGRVDAREYTSEEVMKMYLTDPDRVKELYSKGQLKLDKMPGADLA